MFVSRFCAAVAGVMLLAPFFAYSGSLDSPADPTGTSSAMYTLTDIYNRLDTGTATPKRAGAFTEPSFGPTVATGKTLDEVMGLVISRAPVEKTGQTTSSEAGDDGAWEKGLAWPIPRFTDNGNGTVKDNLTGLIWLKNANAYGQGDWTSALSYCNSLASPSAGLTDGSVAGDWRLPNINELQSLVHFGFSSSPALSDTAGTGQWTDGNPFGGARSDPYWSGTTYSVDPNRAWFVNLRNGYASDILKTTLIYYVWPVRAGQ